MTLAASLGLAGAALALARPPVAVPWWAAVAAASGLAVLYRGAALAVAVATAGLTVRALVASAGRRRSDDERLRAMLVAVRLIVAELEAGSRPAASLSAAAEACPDYAPALRSAAAAAGSGSDVATALGDGELAPVGHAWRVVAATGAAPAQVLQRVADDLDAAQLQRHSVAAATAGPRASAALLALLPAVGLVLGVAMGARPVGFLLDEPAGRIVCCAGVLLDALGLAWTHRLVTRAEAA
ncbi:MAG: tight adherence protein [Pseudonocardiales bacterium]|nr:tight adherence protein [Pseudonocardiales bacterium]